MVHGIPNQFDLTRDGAVETLRNNNQGLLSSLQFIWWAYAHSIAISNPYSSIFISLSDPEEANSAIVNKICFEGELKTTKRSKNCAGEIQCYFCQ